LRRAKKERSGIAPDEPENRASTTPLTGTASEMKASRWADSDEENDRDQSQHLAKQFHRGRPAHPQLIGKQHDEGSLDDGKQPAHPATNISRTSCPPHQDMAANATAPPTPIVVKSIRSPGRLHVKCRRRSP
jgi:hypothetical protein